MLSAGLAAFKGQRINPSEWAAIQGSLGTVNDTSQPIQTRIAAWNTTKQLLANKAAVAAPPGAATSGAALPASGSLGSSGQFKFVGWGQH